MLKSIPPLTRISLLVSCIVLAGWLFSDGQARFKIVYLPPVQTPLGTFDSFFNMDMNDLGQVVGSTWNLTGAFAGFLYTPGQGVKYIDPSGMFNVRLWRINNNGLILGYDGSYSESGRYRIFSYDPQRGYQWLRKNLPQSERVRFVDMNDAGTILAQGRYPWRYSEGPGWQNLTAISRALKPFKSFTLVGMNRNGDFTLLASEKDWNHSYVYFSGSDTLVDLAPIATYGMDINDSGWVVGTAVKWSEPPNVRPLSARPYLYTPNAGLRRIHPPVKAPLIDAFWITAGGTVGGCVEKNGNCASLLTYSKQKEYRTVKEERFRAMLPAGMTFVGVEVAVMNDRNEFVGSVVADDPGGEQRNAVWFLWSPRYGLLDLQKVMPANVKILRVYDLNHRGQILLQVEGAGKSAAVLTPVI